MFIQIYYFRVSCSTVVTLGANVICNNIPGLVTKQRSICNTRPDAMVSIGQGAEQALAECEHQFKNMRWNCSLRSSNVSSLQLGTNLRVGELFYSNLRINYFNKNS